MNLHVDHLPHPPGLGIFVNAGFVSHSNRSEQGEGIFGARTLTALSFRSSPFSSHDIATGSQLGQAIMHIVGLPAILERPTSLTRLTYLSVRLNLDRMVSGMIGGSQAGLWYSIRDKPEKQPNRQENHTDGHVYDADLTSALSVRRYWLVSHPVARSPGVAGPLWHNIIC